MARRSMQEGCILCLPGEPCELHEPKPEAPKAPRKQRVKAVQPKPVDHTCSWCTAEERAAGMPCACNAPSVPVPVDPDPTPAPVNNSDAMRAAMRRRVTAPSDPAPGPAPVQPAVDAVLEDAIRSLAPILDPVERRTYKSIIDQPLSTKGRARAWQERIRS